MVKWQYRTRAEVRAWLAKRMRLSDVAADVWDHERVQECVEAYLAQNGPLEDVRSAAQDIRAHARRVTRSEAALRAGRGNASASASPIPVATLLSVAEQARADADALILAKHVALHETADADGVACYRTDVLGDRFPLSAAEAERFITSAPKAEGGKREKFLYAGKWRTVASDGPVGRLWTLGQRLTKLYGWGTIAAMHFVLTDQPPPLPPMAVQTTVAPAIPPRATITITAEAWLSEETILRAYRAARSHAMRALTGAENAAVRDVSARNWRIYRFVLAHTDAHGERQGTWEELRRAWNGQCAPDEKSDTYAHFRRDFYRAETAQLDPLRRATNDVDV